jgi:hypothetical protein
VALWRSGYWLHREAEQEVDLLRIVGARFLLDGKGMYKYAKGEGWDEWCVVLNWNRRY